MARCDPGGPIGDLRAVVDAVELEGPVLVAFSRGSSYALQFPDRVAGLVVGDYQARHAGLPLEFLGKQLEMMIRGVPVAQRMPEHAVRGVIAESREVPLWDRLPGLRCPVLVVRGGRRSAVVTDDIAARWPTALPTVETATIGDAGHRVEDHVGVEGSVISVKIRPDLGQSMPSMMRKSRSTPSERAASASW